MLSANTLEQMRKPLASQFGQEIWGLGTMLYAPNGVGGFVVGHDGNNEPAINTAVRLNPATGNGIVILETGNRLLATRLAGEWVFWETGNLDFSDGHDGSETHVHGHRGRLDRDPARGAGRGLARPPRASGRDLSSLESGTRSARRAFSLPKPTHPSNEASTMTSIALAVRTLRKTPSFTIIALVTLALGIGVNTSMYTLMDVLLFRAAPFPEPDRLVVINGTSPQSQRDSFSFVEVEEMRAQVAGTRGGRVRASAGVADRPSRSGATPWRSRASRRSVSRRSTRRPTSSRRSGCNPSWAAPSPPRRAGRGGTAWPC